MPAFAGKVTSPNRFIIRRNSRKRLARAFRASRPGNDPSEQQKEKEEGMEDSVVDSVKRTRTPLSVDIAHFSVRICFSAPPPPPIAGQKIARGEPEWPARSALRSSDSILRIRRARLNARDCAIILTDSINRARARARSPYNDNRSRGEQPVSRGITEPRIYRHGGDASRIAIRLISVTFLVYHHRVHFSQRDIGVDPRASER